MNPAIVFLNRIIDGTTAVPASLLDENEACREVIRGFELFPLACGALRTLLEHPGNEEGIAHAKRCLQYLDESNLRALARQAAKLPAPPAPTPTAEESLDDLA